MQQTYIVIALAAFLVIAGVFVFLKRRRPEMKLTPLAAFAFALVIAGISFGENRFLGYGFMGAGVALAVADAVLRSRK